MLERKVDALRVYFNPENNITILNLKLFVLTSYDFSPGHFVRPT